VLQFAIGTGARLTESLTVEEMRKKSKEGREAGRRRERHAFPITVNLEQ